MPMLQPQAVDPTKPAELGKPVNPPCQVLRVRYSPDGELLAAACTDGMDPKTVAKTEAVYQNAAAQIVFRTGAQIEELFEDLEILEPGLKDVSQWRVDEPIAEIHVTAGVGRKP